MLIAQTPANSNLTLVGQLPYAQNLNDIWGYVDSTGIEYALVGTRTGTSIVSLATPASPQEVLFIPGSVSTWRDLKTWGDYAYVSTDKGSGKDGILIINLGPLPSGTPTYTFWRPELTINGVTDTLNTIHNLYIDENGYGYVAGSNVSSGEPFILDLNTTPGTPIYLGATPPVYAHDVYTRGDTLWTSDIYAGNFSAYDVSNKTAPVFLASQSTPRTFTHNAWISDDGKTLFTTDEKADAWIGAYDVSDLGNIQELDRWITPTQRTIPHNVHVLNDYIVASYYTDGVVVLDASHPDNMIEVGRYDSYHLWPSTGFYGAWGAYPFLPSGLLLVSDMQTGLHVLQPNYQRACRLEGIVTETGTGSPLFGAIIELTTTTTPTNTDLFGSYKVGTATAGTYNATFKKVGYIPKTIPVTLVNGQVTVANVDLELAVPFSISGKVAESFNNTVAVANAKVRLKSSLYDYTTVADANGDFSINILPDDNYIVYAGKWAYHTNFQGTINAVDSTNLPTIIVTLDQGYKDEFVLDLGWTVAGNATDGVWERAKPTQLYSNGIHILPEGDIGHDIGDDCYITGNNGGGVFGVNDVDGETILESPIFDLTSYTAAELSYHFYLHQPWPPSSVATFEASITNGISTVQLDQDSVEYEWSIPKTFILNDYITPTANMQVVFKVIDTSNIVVEAGFDLFEIRDTASVVSVNSNLEEERLSSNVYPNPFTHTVRVDYNLPLDSANEHNSIQVYNLLGQEVEKLELKNKQGHLEIGKKWDKGIYFIAIQNEVFKVLKQ